MRRSSFWRIGTYPQWQTPEDNRMLDCMQHLICLGCGLTIERCPVSLCPVTCHVNRVVAFCNRSHPESFENAQKQATSISTQVLSRQRSRKPPHRSRRAKTRRRRRCCFGATRRIRSNMKTRYSRFRGCRKHLELIIDSKRRERCAPGRSLPGIEIAASDSFARNQRAETFLALVTK
jgi:hypothetical protein